MRLNPSGSHRPAQQDPVCSFACRSLPEIPSGGINAGLGLDQLDDSAGPRVYRLCERRQIAKQHPDEPGVNGPKTAAVAQRVGGGALMIVTDVRP